MSLINSQMYDTFRAGGMPHDEALRAAAIVQSDLMTIKADVALLQLDMRLVEYSLWVIGVLVGILLVQVFTVHS
jgi:hypothetical protein